MEDEKKNIQKTRFIIRTLHQTLLGCSNGGDELSREWPR
jgi:hypothetical protein